MPISQPTRRKRLIANKICRSLNCSDYSTVTRKLFAAIELRVNDYSTVTRKSIDGRVIGQIGSFGTWVDVCAVQAYRFWRLAGLSEGFSRLKVER